MAFRFIHSRTLRALGAVPLLLSSLSLHAQTQGSTAIELLNRGAVAYNAGDFATATSAFEEFLTTYGESAEAAEAIPRMMPLLALSHVRLKQFAKARESIAKALAFPTRIQAPTLEELRFWEGVCALQDKDFPAARAALNAYSAAYAALPRAADAKLLSATAWLLEENFAEAAAAIKPLLPALGPQARGRATVLLLFALLRSDARDDALKLFINSQPHLADLSQIAAFQMLALGLGAEFLEAGELRKSIAVFQRIPRRTRILELQDARQKALENRLAIAKTDRSAAREVFDLERDLADVTRDRAALEKVPHFDSALRLRLATAFQKMDRFREAALIMDDMLASMPPDPVVESASVNLVQCWSTIRRWPDAIAAADRFEKSFPDSAQLPLVLFLKAQALSDNSDPARAAAAFESVFTRFPKHDIASRAFFLRGFNFLLADDNASAIASFEAFPKKFPNDPLAESVAYWRAMAYSLDKQHTEARGFFAAHIKNYPEGRYLAEARYRKAYCAQSLRDHETAIKELRQYLKLHDGHAQNSEAKVLLGDALYATGQIEEGTAAFLSIPPEDTKFFEEGWFKVGKALRAQEKLPELRAHMERFRAEHPGSPRVAEAVYWLGWAWTQEGEPGKATEAYLSALRELGDMPEARAVEDLIAGIIKFDGKTGGGEPLLETFRTLRRDADANNKTHLALRMVWAQALMFRRSEPALADAMLAEAAIRLRVQQTNPAIIADCADALTRQGNPAEGAKLFRELIRWNPRAAQKDRALAALGNEALRTGDRPAALEWFARLENETPGSPLLGAVLLEKAQLEMAAGDRDAAQQTFERLLARRAVPARTKAEALVAIGDMLLEAGRASLAIPYYQRVYVMYSRHSDFVARAYLGSGKAFEKLADPTAARKTYEEMLAQPEMEGRAESAEAKLRLQNLQS